MSWIDSLKDYSAVAKDVATSAAQIRQDWSGAFTAGGTGSVAAAQASHAATVGAAQANGGNVPAARVWSADNVTRIMNGNGGNQGALLLVAAALAGYLLLKKFG